MNRLHVLVIDDDRIYALGLKSWFANLAMGACVRIADAVPCEPGGYKPDLVVVDPELVGITPTVTVKELRRHYPDCRIVVCAKSEWFARGHADRVMAAGAHAFYCKGEPDEALLFMVLGLLGGAAREPIPLRPPVELDAAV